MSRQSAVLLLSGGLDSTSLLYRMIAQKNGNPVCLVFDYGQTLAKEVGVALDNARRVNVEAILVHAPMGWIAPQCALFNGMIPHHRTLETIAQGGPPLTYVPFRNGIMMAYAAAVAEARGITTIACGGNGLNSGNYPDDTLEFGLMMQQAINMGTAPRERPYQVSMPNSRISKAQVVALGIQAGMDPATTWSCYHSRAEHCGVCDSCVQRTAALAGAAEILNAWAN